MISIPAAGHITPIFELAKAMRNHNVTFITESFARSYLNLNTISNKSSLHIIYTNNSNDELLEQKKIEEESTQLFMNQSIFDTIFFILETMQPSINPLLQATVHELMTQHYDVIIANSAVLGISTLCVDVDIPCVIHHADSMPHIFDINLPVGYLLLTSEQSQRFPYRIINIAFTIRLFLTNVYRGINSILKASQYLPRIPGPYYDSFTFTNLSRQKPNQLKLYSIPQTLFPSSSIDPRLKYMGAFVDESSMQTIENNLSQWIKSKPDNSIIFLAFGSSGIITENRMKSLIEGLAAFLLQTPHALLLLGFRKRNYETYNKVYEEMTNDDFRRILSYEDRVRIENQFLPQKSILNEKSVGIFLTHCGMGSIVESLYFEKPIICLPVHSDQFLNAIAVEYSKVGQSLFIPPSLFQSFLHPQNFHDYTFSSDRVFTIVSSMFMNSSYKEAARMMSLEMKHAGGVKRAVEEIEHLVDLKGDFDRYMPFTTKLPFYQRYMLDIILVYLVIPIIFFVYFFRKCCHRNRKQKVE